MAATEAQYQFSAEPRRVMDRRRKYRDPQEEELDKAPSVNIMFNPRVVRGSTFAAMVETATKKQDSERQKLDLRHRNRQEKRQREIDQDDQLEPLTPPPLEGRDHIDIQTDNLLELPVDKPPEKEAEVQTDYLPSEFVAFMHFPTLTGSSVETQIEDGELFSFNVEVSPLLDELCGKTLELARMEVLEEEELEAMRRHQREFQQKKHEEMIETQRLEAEEVKRHQESERRKLQARNKKESMISSHQKFCARIIAKQYLSQVKDNCIERLRELRYFLDKREVSFHNVVLPTVIDGAFDQNNYKDALGCHFNGVIKDSFEILCQKHKEAVQSEYKRREEEKQWKLKQAQDEIDRKKKRVEMRRLRLIEQKKNAIVARMVMLLQPNEKWREYFNVERLRIVSGEIIEMLE